jgi:RimJ/RimL family protein N-acetyltransferase
MTGGIRTGLRPDVSLAPLGPEHAEATFRWVLDPQVSRQLGLRTEPSLEKTRDWIRNASADPAFAAFAVLLKGRHVGNVVLDRLDRYLSTARFSIYLGEPDARGAGVGFAATCLAVETAFSKLGLQKVWLTVHIENAPALRTYLRAGFVQEGVLRGEFLLDGRRTDVFYMGVLRGEWQCPPRASGGGRP